VTAQKKRRNAHGTHREAPPRPPLRSEGQRRIAVDLRVRPLPEPALLRRLAQAHQGRSRGEALLVRRGRQAQRRQGYLSRDTRRRRVKPSGAVRPAPPTLGRATRPPRLRELARERAPHRLDAPLQELARLFPLRSARLYARERDQLPRDRAVVDPGQRILQHFDRDGEPTGASLGEERLED